jgi:signal recognition particle GTPase
MSRRSRIGCVDVAVGVAAGGSRASSQGVDETVSPRQSKLSKCDHRTISSPSSNDSAKRKTKTKAGRKWGDETPSETDMASLDFSVDKAGSERPTPDLQSLVDEASLGTRTKDGMYEVKDWDFGPKDDETDDEIARALGPGTSSKPSASSLGSLGSLFARLTGSKVLTEDDLQPVLEGMKQHLMKKNVAKEIADKVCEGVGESLVGKKVGGFQSTCARVSWYRCAERVSSDEQCRPHGTVDFPDKNPHSQDLYRSLVVHPDEAHITSHFLSTTHSV